MSEKTPSRGRGPDLRPRRSRARPAAASTDAHSQRPQPSGLEDFPIELNRLYLLDDRLVQVKRRNADGRVLVLDQDDGSERRVLPGELRPRASDAGSAESNERDALAHSELTEEQQAESVRRLDLIRPLLDPAKRSEHLAKSLARQAGTSARTLYRWLGAYLEGGLRALAPAARGLIRGATLLEPRVEEIIEKAVLEAFDAGESSVTALGLLPSIQTACEALPPGPDGKPVSPPGQATIQRRLPRLRKNYKNHKGETRRVLRDLQQPVTGSIDARRALEIVEIDHTVMDVHAVDAETLEPIGRFGAGVGPKIAALVQLTDTHPRLNSPVLEAFERDFSVEQYPTAPVTQKALDDLRDKVVADVSQDPLKPLIRAVITQMAQHLHQELSSLPE